MKAAALIMAAGSSKRMRSGINKPYLLYKGRPVIFYSLKVMSKIRDINEIIIVIRRKDEKICRRIIAKYGLKNTRICYGGEKRQDSVYNGLKEVKESNDLVLVHDAARPFISVKLVKQLIKEAKIHKAVIPALPVKETVKRLSDGWIVDATLDRSKLYLAQTPQVFDRKLIVRAYEEAYKTGFFGTDDAMLVEHLNFPVIVIPGEEKNIKITVREDLK